MMTVRENVARVAALVEQIKAHPMCLRFDEGGGRYFVRYPAGMRLDGVRAAYRDCGKIVALERILAAMERHWVQSGVYANPPPT